MISGRYDGEGDVRAEVQRLFRKTISALVFLEASPQRIFYLLAENLPIHFQAQPHDLSSLVLLKSIARCSPVWEWI